MKKPLVAFIHLGQKNCERFYGCFDKTGKLLTKYTVYDSGHGGSLAIEAAKKKYNISCAEWTHKLAQKIRN